MITSPMTQQMSSLKILETDIVRAYTNDYLTPEEISIKLDCNVRTVLRYLKDNGIDVKSTNHTRKEQRNEDVCRMYNSGKTVGYVAEKFGITNQRVSQILRANGYKGRIKDGYIAQIALLTQENERLRRLLYEKTGIVY